MKKTLLIVLALTMILSLSAMAAKTTSTPVVHITQIYQVSPGAETDTADLAFTGYADSGQNGPTIDAVPGVLSICSGGITWPNYILAAQSDVAYTIKNTTLTKVTPTHVQCGFDAAGNPIFPAQTITQQGTPNIRTWWPLMYELPGTTFTLNILYGTPSLFQDSPVNPPAWVHQETWQWNVSSDLTHLNLLLDLFHELPFGTDEVPLISDEVLYVQLKGELSAAQQAATAGNYFAVGNILGDFELDVMDGCIGSSPSFPNVTGDGTGIANTDENPACCKLLIDAGYLLQTYGYGQPAK